jgi:RNA polymerase-binding transcription factor DksA
MAQVWVVKAKTLIASSEGATNLTDQFDHASKLEQLAISKALQNHQQRKEKPLVINGVRCCLDCGEPILLERVKSVDAVRCITDQVYHEALQKHQRG